MLKKRPPFLGRRPSRYYFDRSQVLGPGATNLENYVLLYTGERNDRSKLGLRMNLHQRLHGS